MEKNDQNHIHMLRKAGAGSAGMGIVFRACVKTLRAISIFPAVLLCSRPGISGVISRHS